MLVQRTDSNDAAAEALEPNELVRRAQAGCVESFAALVNHFHPRVIEMLQRRYGAERGEAEDLAQEAFAKAFQRLGQFDPSYQFSTWLYTIAKRGAIDRGRRRQREPQQVPLAVDQAPGLEADVAVVVERREEAENIWRRARALLSEPQYTATWLRFADGCEIAEIARRMKRSRIGVRVLLHRARNILVRELADEAEPSPPSTPGRGS
jgi:RNA polymerase sigma factor (sigma-70 family)